MSREALSRHGLLNVNALLRVVGEGVRASRPRPGAGYCGILLMIPAAWHAYILEVQGQISSRAAGFRPIRLQQEPVSPV